MARTESRTKTDIWNNDDFRGLSRLAQRLYWLMYSQPTISLCGVVAYTPGRWARLSCDDTVDDVWTGICELEEKRFVVVDTQTEEVFVRSFMRNDGVWRSPKTQGAARDQANAVMSKGMRKAIDLEMGRLDGTVPDTPPHTLSIDPNDPADGVSDTHPDRTRAGAHASSNSFSVSGLHSPSPSDDDSLSHLQGARDSVSSSSGFQSQEGMTSLGDSLSKLGIRP